jgi:hydroxymethylglutaryl-CoA lyase
MNERFATLVEVGPRDGFQSIGTIIPTATKISLLQDLYSAGVRRIEVTAFVSEKAVPQFADAVEILSAARALPGMDPQVLVPNERHAERAIRAGARHLAFVLSVSEKHNKNNVRRTPRESAAEYRRIVAGVPTGTKIRLNVATAFDCPFDGAIDLETTLALMEELVDAAPHAEICPCDTTGRVTPDRVGALFAAAKLRFPTTRHWAYHGHDTFGLGVANVVAAWGMGVSQIDASIAGLGGCPFAPGATGNVASEDVVWMFHNMGVRTGIDIRLLTDVARKAVALPGSLSGGRVRDALTAQLCLAKSSGEVTDS